jgi:hypothetical protein
MYVFATAAEMAMFGMVILDNIMDETTPSDVMALMRPTADCASAIDT